QLRLRRAEYFVDCEPDCRMMGPPCQLQGVAPVFWLWLGLGIVGGLLLVLCLLGVLLFYHLKRRYLDYLVRIFQEKPLFIIPRGQPVSFGEDVRFQTEDGRTLVGCYLRTSATRRGVILFGLEFGSNRWACVSYCEQLLANGFDIFTFEFRSQGD